MGDRGRAAAAHPHRQATAQDRLHRPEVEHVRLQPPAQPSQGDRGPHVVHRVGAEAVHRQGVEGQPGGPDVGGGRLVGSGEVDIPAIGGRGVHQRGPVQAEVDRIVEYEEQARHARPTFRADRGRR